MITAQYGRQRCAGTSSGDTPVRIIGMRYILVHEYFDIGTDIVWDAATYDVSSIKPAVYT
jgi:uncharacterized protein with HEPN domain